jgi:hypothetical protein
VRQATRQFWPGRIRIQNLNWVATINIPILYVFEMIPLIGIEKSFTTADFRWQWAARLWGELSVEFFAANMSAYLLMAVGLVSRTLAERAAYSALILIFLGGVLGTGRYWAGGHSMRVPLGSSTTMCSKPFGESFVGPYRNRGTLELDRQADNARRWLGLGRAGRRRAHKRKSPEMEKLPAYYNQRSPTGAHPIIQYVWIYPNYHLRRLF